VDGGSTHFFKDLITKIVCCRLFPTNHSDQGNTSEVNE